MMRNWQFAMLMLMVSATLMHNLTQAKVKADLTDCQENLKNMATACEMYSTDNCGCYPHRLDQLVPEYLPTLPHCPTGAPHYGYQWADVHTGPHSQWVDAFSICCQGQNHSQAQQPKNFPQFFDISRINH